jgi:hypothetical protein
LSLVNYMVSIWGCTSAKYLIIIDKVLRALARLLLRLRKYDKVADKIKNDLKWMWPEQLCRFKTLCIMYKIFNDKNVPYFDNYFKQTGQVHFHNTRGSDLNVICDINPKTELGKNSFKYKGTVWWNELSSDVKQAKNFNIFKGKLKELIMVS